MLVKIKVTICRGAHAKLLAVIFSPIFDQHVADALLRRGHMHYCASIQYHSKLISIEFHTLLSIIAWTIFNMAHWVLALFSLLKSLIQDFAAIPAENGPVYMRAGKLHFGPPTDHLMTI